VQGYNLTFNEWIKNRILQENYQPEHTGILKVKPNPTQIVEIQNRVLKKFPDLKPLPQDKLHVTMLHQQLAKPLKGVALPPLQTELTFNPSQIYVVERDGKKSVFAVVTEQEELKRYMEELASQMGVQIELNRTYHVTVANLTGNVADSVGHSEQDPIMNGAHQITLD
jgi:2'-5' RNA ligase